MICPCCGKEMERNKQLDKMVNDYLGGEKMDIRKMILMLIEERKISDARTVHNPR